MKEWTITTSELVGTSHLPNDVPCQDKTHYLKKNNVTVMALSDGCGSSILSHVGADITVRTLCDLLVDSFDTLLEMDALKSREFILKYIVDALQDYVDQANDVSIKDLNATFLFVAVNQDDVALMGHIGDGYIGAVQKDVLQIKSMEKKTGEVNGTVYPTSNHAEYFLQLKRGSAKDIDAFVMMSDGGGDGLVDSRVPFVKQFAPHVAGVIEYMGSHDETDNQAFMDKLILRVRDHIFSGDDCSLAVMVLPDVKVTSIEPLELDKPLDEEVDAPPVKTIEETAHEIQTVEEVYYFLKRTLYEASNITKDQVEAIVNRLEKDQTIEDIASGCDIDESLVLEIKQILYELTES